MHIAHPYLKPTFYDVANICYAALFENNALWVHSVFQIQIELNRNVYPVVRLKAQ